MNLFDIIGPVMIGPSSSHTAGAARLGFLARKVLGGRPVKATISLYGSFAHTYKGHGTDLALVAGLLGWLPDDERLPHSFGAAREAGLEFAFVLKSDEEFVHPNTAHFILESEEGYTCEVGGASLGGGRVVVSDIDGFPVELTGELAAILTIHDDRPGVVAAVSRILAENAINIASMRVFRQQKGGLAAMVIEADGELARGLGASVGSVSGIKSVRLIDKVV